METAGEKEINRRRTGDSELHKSAEETGRKQIFLSYLAPKPGKKNPYIYPFKQHFRPIRISDKLHSISRGIHS